MNHSKKYFEQNDSRADELFAKLFVFQWFMSVALACFLTPRVWAGGEQQFYFHFFLALLVGGVLALIPTLFIHFAPGRPINAYVNATAQILFSALYIHLSGGRIETHFHVFASLTLLALYRSYGPVILATAVAIADLLIRGSYWPESVYGLFEVKITRVIENTFWLCLAGSIYSFHYIKYRFLEKALQKSTDLVEQKIKEIQSLDQRVIEQEQALMASSKMASLGRMSSDIAHEINTPLTVISMKLERLENDTLCERIENETLLGHIRSLKKTTFRIAKIAHSIKFFSKNNKKEDLFEKIQLCSIIDDTLDFCYDRFSNYGIFVEVTNNTLHDLCEIECRSVEISQVLLNLLNNSFDAVKSLEERWIHIEIKDTEDTISLSVTDSGKGIPEELQDRLMLPFFTTKEHEDGTGLGLSISKNIVDKHQGKFFLDKDSPHTKFTMQVPKIQPKLHESQVA